MECYGDLSKVIIVDEYKIEIFGNGFLGGDYLRSCLEFLDDEDSWDVRMRCVWRMLMLFSRVSLKVLRVRYGFGLEW